MTTSRFVIALDTYLTHIGSLPDGQTLTQFWNRQKGWGQLADATVFTEAERETFNEGRPEGDGEPRWLQLPKI